MRQEQLKERLGDRFRELDVPLLVQWPDGRREGLLFVVEEEFVACELASIAYERFRDSSNIVARLNLPNMRYAPEAKIDVYAHAVRGLVGLEKDPEKQLKYIDFIDIYADLDDNERARYEQEYSDEAEIMSNFSERFIQQGMQQGRREGRREGEATILLRLLQLKFGDVPEAARQRIENTDSQLLLEWSERVLTANNLEEVIGSFS